MTQRLAAITGATGFLGRHLVRSLAEQGWQVRILARRDPVDPLWTGLEPQVVPGALGDGAALDRLCSGAEVVIHAAGLIKARSRADFEAVNVTGARRVAEAARTAQVPKVLLVSSLAAREPHLSDYAASKRGGESAAAEVLGDRLTIARPPAVYGPGDTETFGLFKAAQEVGVLPAFDPAARIALIHVTDAADQLARLAEQPVGRIVALSDSRPEGYGWLEIVRTAGAAVGRDPRVVRLPDGVLSLLGVAGAAGRLLGATPMLTPGKARELRHLDWGVASHELPAGLPAPRFGLLDGFRQTVNWYRRAGWLRLY